MTQRTYLPDSFTSVQGKIVDQILEAMLRHLKEREVIWNYQHGLTKVKSCLTNLMAFYDGTSASVNKERASNAIWTSVRPLTCSSKSKLGRYGFDGWTIQWTRNCWCNCTQRVVVSGSVSRWGLEMSGVPHVSTGTDTL